MPDSRLSLDLGLIHVVVCRYSPDPTPNTRQTCPTLSSSPADPLPPTFQRYGEDAAFLGQQNYIGVAEIGRASCRERV